MIALNNKTLFGLPIHKRHPIARPSGRARGCLLCVLCGKNYLEISRALYLFILKRVPFTVYALQRVNSRVCESSQSPATHQYYTPECVPLNSNMTWVAFHKELGCPKCKLHKKYYHFSLSFQISSMKFCTNPDKNTAVRCAKLQCDLVIFIRDMISSCLGYYKLRFIKFLVKHPRNYKYEDDIGTYVIDALRAGRPLQTFIKTAFLLITKPFLHLEKLTPVWNIFFNTRGY